MQGFWLIRPDGARSPIHDYLEAHFAEGSAGGALAATPGRPSRDGGALGPGV